MKVYVLAEPGPAVRPASIRDVRRRGRRGLGIGVMVVGCAVTVWMGQPGDDAPRTTTPAIVVAPAMEPSSGHLTPDTSTVTADRADDARRETPIQQPRADPRPPTSVDIPPIPGLPLLAAARAAPDGWALAGVRPGSLMARMGLQDGDVIMSVGGRLVAGRADGPSMLAPAMLGTPTPAYVLRDGQTVLISLVLAKRPVAASMPAS